MLLKVWQGQISIASPAERGEVRVQVSSGALSEAGAVLRARSAAADRGGVWSMTCCVSPVSARMRRRLRAFSDGLEQGCGRSALIARQQWHAAGIGAGRFLRS
ncbi:MAG: hypothetical protein IPJ97_16735 [Proteobacteria bacterium]|nr:hypothetical protein [Pseudomonadota bacterium]